MGFGSSAETWFIWSLFVSLALFNLLHWTDPRNFFPGFLGFYHLLALITQCQMMPIIQEQARCRGLSLPRSGTRAGVCGAAGRAVTQQLPADMAVLIPTAGNRRGDGNRCSWEQSPVLHTAWCSTVLGQGSKLIAWHWWLSHPSAPSRWVVMKEFTCVTLGPLCCYQRRAFLLPFIFWVGWRRQAPAFSPTRLQPQAFTNLCTCMGWRGPPVAPVCVWPNCSSPPSWSFGEALTQHSHQPGLWGLCAVLK